ncbi:MAG TPA: anthranilate synthase component I family protein, partial [Steroidobacteraceae bacterium]|nr:anthranilate synthase component I family protein [Steroidobacteraceae bacterium]
MTSNLFDISADLDTPVSAYLKLKPFQPRFLLESVEGGERLARYSFIGFGDCLEFRLDASGLALGVERLPRPADQASLLAAMRRGLAAAPRPDIPNEGFPLHGGLVGVTSYDLVRYFERLPSNARIDDDCPEAHYMAPRSLLVFDHLTRRAALLHAGSEHERQGLRREIIRALRGGLPGPAWAASFSAPEASLSEEQFLDGVARTKEYIAAGDVYQLVLSVRFAGRCDLDPFETYRALRLLNPSPYMYYCDLGDRVVVGSSPEALVKLNGTRATMRPIAGTRPRGADSRQDTELETELLADPKENAEHVMLVDLARNDLGRVATAGSVHVHPYRSIERYSHVMHIVSGVNGTLAPGKDAFDLFAATFPAGTLVGAPKVRAMEIIDELEPTRRGIYAGAVGYVSFHDDMDLAIAIRTAVVKDGTLYAQTGAGIVHDSVPASEWQETLTKARAVLRAAE